MGVWILTNPQLTTTVLEFSPVNERVASMRLQVVGRKSTDHHLVVSWIRWWGRLLDRPGKPRYVARVNWECLAEAPVHEVFNSHLRKKFSCILAEAGDVESEWAMFKFSIVEAVVRSCGWKVVGACCGGNLRRKP